MGSQRAHIVLPPELLREIDSLVGPRGRSAFLVQTARAEINRRRLLSFLQSDQPAWQDKNHPELASGAKAWVQQLRLQSEANPAQPKRREKRTR